jgi:hypothetical protein
MTWWRVIYENGKTHFIPEPLKVGVLANLVSRGLRVRQRDDVPAGFSPLDKTTEGWVDFGGGAFKDETWYTFDISGLQMKFRARDLDEYYEVLGKLGVRKELSEDYYKLHGFLSCLCLLPDQRGQLLHDIAAKLPEARAVAEAEFQGAGWRTPRSPGPSPRA